MDYVYVVMWERDGDMYSIAAYQYEEDALAYIERERAIHPRLAQYLLVEKVVFKV